MKTTLFFFTAMFALNTNLSSSAFADLNTQMNFIQGDWQDKQIFRISMQSNNSIKVYLDCNRNIYYNSPNHRCSYDAVQIFQYRNDLDAFYAPEGETYCSELLQVSIGNPSKMIRIADPYRADQRCGISGKTQEFKKL